MTPGESFDWAYWKDRAERAEKALATARREALEEAAKRFEDTSSALGPLVAKALRALPLDIGGAK